MTKPPTCIKEHPSHDRNQNGASSRPQRRVLAKAIMKQLTKIPSSTRTVLVRADVNVPMRDGRVTDHTRLTRLVPTLQALTALGLRVAVISHFGRPKGKPLPEASLRTIADALANCLKMPVGFAEDCIGTQAQQAIAACKPGGIVLLENLRFHGGEEANDPAFVKQLADLADVYVNDAFSACHRAHASIDGLARTLPAYAGINLAAEIKALQQVTDHPNRPIMGIVGGAKVSTKLELLAHLLSKLDLLAIGGGMANTFLGAMGLRIGKSLAEPDLFGTAKGIMESAKRNGKTILLPSDGIVAEGLSSTSTRRVASVDQVLNHELIADIGPETIRAWEAAMGQAKTILWNGPPGAFEISGFELGALAIADKAANLAKNGETIVVAGGGDTVAALEQAGVTETLTYVSTAGGAFLEYLEGKELPGLAALNAHHS